MPAIALADTDPPPEPPSAEESSIELPGAADIAIEIAKAEREEEEREKWLASPVAVEQREASWLAYGDLGPTESEALLLETFEKRLAVLNSDPARTLSDAQLVRPIDESSAIVREENTSSLLEGEMPVRTENEDGDLRKVDLDLEATPDGYETANGISDLELPESAEEPIEVGGEGFGISQVGAEETDTGRLLGTQNVFYPNVLPDTDLMVAATATGAEIFNLLRSKESPEELRFAVDVPEGAVLREDGNGGAQVIREDTVLTRVPKPIAFDAQETVVPVDLSVEGSEIVLHVPHRDGDYAAPILVDPIIEDWVNTSWYWGQKLEALTNGAWQWSGNNSSIYKNICCWGGKYAGLMATTTANTYFGPEQFGQWAYSMPNTGSYIEHAWISPFYRYDESCGWSNQPHDYDGIWNQELNKYNPVNTNRALTGTDSMDGWGHAFIIGIGTGPPGVWIQCARHVYAGGVALWLNDYGQPYIKAVNGIPSGWVSDATPFTIAAEVRDDGLGVQFVTISPDGAPIIQDQVGCSGLYGSRCPTAKTSTFNLNGLFFDEGIKTASINVQDPLGKTGTAYIWQTKVDRTPPDVTLDGQLAIVTNEAGSAEVPAGKGDNLSLPVYNLKIEAKDGSNSEEKLKRSGVKSIEVQLDGKQMQRWEKTCYPATSCSMTQIYQLRLQDISAGQHTLKVIAVDEVKKARERQIEFKYIPATGIKDEYIMQYFPLPNGQGNEATEEFPDRPEFAVNVMNGNLVYREKDVEINSFNANLEVNRYYNSMLPTAQNSEWGDGWTLSQAPEFEPTNLDGLPGPDEARLTSATGSVEEGVQLPAAVGSSHFDPVIQSTIKKEADENYAFVDETGRKTSTVFYDKYGKVAERRSESNVAVDYTYSGGVLDEISIDDPYSAGKPVEKTAPTFSPAYAAAFGVIGASNGQLKAPAGVAVNSNGDLWVVDKGNNRIQKFNAKGEYLTKFGSAGSGNGQFNRPAAVAVDSKDNIWVADANNNRIQKFNAKGEYLTKFGSAGSGNGQFSTPEGLAIDAENNVWVGDTLNGRLQKFNESGTFLQVIGSKGSGKGQLGQPTDLDFDPDGNVWISDWEYHRVVGFTANGVFIREFGSLGTGNGQFNRPDSIEVDPLGGIWVGDQNNHRVERFTDDGKYFEQFGSKGAGAGQFSFTYPMGITTDPMGAIWITDQGNNRVQKWTIQSSTPPTEGEDQSIDLSAANGLITGLSGEVAGSHTYTHSGDDLTAHKGPGGETKYVYNASGQMTKVTLPNGTYGGITYNASTGRVNSVTVDPAGSEPAKTTFFTFQDEPRRTTVTPPQKPVITFDIGADGSILEWWNAIKPPEFDDLAGDLYGSRETAAPITSGDHNLIAQAYSDQGIRSITVLANGSEVVDEKTCPQVDENPSECTKVINEWVTNTGEHAPGILYLEVVLMDRFEHMVSRRFWVNMPPPPPPLAPGTPIPPKFKDVLRFREDHGLDVDLGPAASELDINDRVFSSLGDWWAGVPLARAAMERWGAPLREREVAELEDRLADHAQAGSALPNWVAANASTTYAGYYVDEREGGVIHVGFTTDQSGYLTALKGSGSLIGADRLAAFPGTPTYSLAQLESLEKSVLSVSAGAPAGLIATVGIDVKANSVTVGSNNVAQATAFLESNLGPQPLIIQYEDVSPGPRGRQRDEGSVRAGDYIAGGYFEYQCTAGVGAWDNVLEINTGWPVHRTFLLSAAHCFWPKEQVLRPNPETGVFRSFGVVTRSGAVQGGFGETVNGYSTDAVAARVNDPMLAPRQIYLDEDKEPLDIHAAVQTPSPGGRLCHSGITTDEVLCGSIIGPPRTFSYKPNTTTPQTFLEVCYRAVSIPGDSGAPVWVEGTHNAVGLVSYGWNFLNAQKQIVGGVTCLTPLRPISGRPEAPGALHAPGMNGLSIITRTP
jgi:YD repeat-containing protein